jgi:hypothetical protein
MAMLMVRRSLSPVQHHFGYSRVALVSSTDSYVATDPPHPQCSACTPHCIRAHSSHCGVCTVCDPGMAPTAQRSSSPMHARPTSPSSPTCASSRAAPTLTRTFRRCASPAPVSSPSSPKPPMPHASLAKPTATAASAARATCGSPPTERRIMTCSTAPSSHPTARHAQRSPRGSWARASARRRMRATPPSAKHLPHGHRRHRSSAEAAACALMKQPRPHAISRPTTTATTSGAGLGSHRLDGRTCFSLARSLPPSLPLSLPRWLCAHC